MPKHAHRPDRYRVRISKERRLAHRWSTLAMETEDPVEREKAIRFARYWSSRC